jgi:hypothetical protein
LPFGRSPKGSFFIPGGSKQKALVEFIPLRYIMF